MTFVVSWRGIFWPLDATPVGRGFPSVFYQTCQPPEHASGTLSCLAYRVHCNINEVYSWQHYPAFRSAISWFQHQISKTKPICMEILRIVHAYSKGVFICWLQCRSHIQQIQTITIFFLTSPKVTLYLCYRNRLQYFAWKSNLIKDLPNTGRSLHWKVCTGTITNLNRVQCYVTAQCEISFWISNWIHVSFDSVLINKHNASSWKQSVNLWNYHGSMVYACLHKK